MHEFLAINPALVWHLGTYIQYQMKLESNGNFFLFQEHAHFRVWPIFYFLMFIYLGAGMCVTGCMWMQMSACRSLFSLLWGSQEMLITFEGKCFYLLSHLSGPNWIFYCNFKGNIIFSLIYTFSWLLSVAQRIPSSQGSYFSFYLRWVNAYFIHAHCSGGSYVDNRRVWRSHVLEPGWAFWTLNSVFKTHAGYKAAEVDQANVTLTQL